MDPVDRGRCSVDRAFQPREALAWRGETLHAIESGTGAAAELAHIVADKVEAAYRRGDLFEKRRKLMDAWATFCNSPPIERGEVISLRGG